MIYSNCCFSDGTYFYFASMDEPRFDTFKVYRIPSQEKEKETQ
jgi:hypothetical protein